MADITPQITDTTLLHNASGFTLSSPEMTSNLSDIALRAGSRHDLSATQPTPSFPGWLLVICEKEGTLITATL